MKVRKNKIQPKGNNCGMEKPPWHGRPNRFTATAIEAQNMFAHRPIRVRPQAVIEGTDDEFLVQFRRFFHERQGGETT
jgi:hypothetical protein